MKRPTKCEYSDCERTLLIACILPSFTGPLDGEHADEWLCAEHAQQGGYCWGCGRFFAGVESFDFDPLGLCDDCRIENNFEDDRFDDDDDTCGGRYPYGWDSYETEIRP